MPGPGERATCSRGPSRRPPFLQRPHGKWRLPCLHPPPDDREAKAEGRLGGWKATRGGMGGPGLPEARGGGAGPSPARPDIRLPVGVVQMLPEARDSERILEPFQDPASAGLTRRQALGPAGACVNRTTRSLFTQEMAPLCQRTRASRARVTEVQRCGPAGSGGGAEAGSSACSRARRRPGCAAQFLTGYGPVLVCGPGKPLT